MVLRKNFGGVGIFYFARVAFLAKYLLRRLTEHGRKRGGARFVGRKQLGGGGKVDTFCGVVGVLLVPAFN